MQQAITQCRILRDGALLEDHAVVIAGDRIVAIVEAAQVAPGMPRHELGGAILAPGLIDIQVNGGGGVLFNDMPTIEGIRAIGAAHARYGTTGFLPTLISADLDEIARAMAAVDDAIAANVPGVLGIHVEGPFLNRARKGIHDETRLRPLDGAALSLLTRPRRGRVVLTLAPEIVPPAMIRTLADAGVLVCAGHTDADFAAIRRGLDAGLRGFTHLFNAMSQLAARQPGAVGAALDDRESWCGIIVDGHHVHPAVLRLALAAKGTGRLMLVTDAMPSVGMTGKDFRLQGRDIAMSGGALRGADGTLAGSDLDMASAVRNAMAMMGVTLPQAIAMASESPAAFLRLSDKTGAIAPGLKADFIVLDDHCGLRETWIGGRVQARG